MSNKQLLICSRQQLSIEELPNELFLHIFNYLQPEDLFQSFGNLNSRFCVLIRSPFIRFCVTNDNVTLFSVIKAEQIKSMILNDSTSFHIVMNYFKKEYFTQLQRLDFTFIEFRSMRTLLNFIPQLDNLKFLRIVGRREESCEEAEVFCQTIAQLIFTPPFFTRLKYIEILIYDMIPYYGYMPRPNPLSMLEYLSIHSICLDDLAILLTWMPKIKSLKIVYAFIINDDDGQFREHDLTSRSLMQMPKIVSLQRLNIGICNGVTCKHMQLLLINLPELCRLNCVVWSEYAFVIEQWIPIFLRSKINWLLFTMITMGQVIYQYLSEELQADVWSRHIFHSCVFTEVSAGICLEAHGLNMSRISLANELDKQSSNEQQRKKQRTH